MATVEIMVELDRDPEAMATAMLEALAPGAMGSVAQSNNRPATVGRRLRTASAGELPIRLASARAVSDGISYQTPTGRAGRLPHAFFAPTLSGGIYERRGKGRLPIDKLYSRLPSGIYQRTKSAARRGA